MSQLLSQYGPNIGIALAGLKADSKPADILSLINGNRANQVQTVTVADTWATGDTLKIDIFQWLLLHQLQEMVILRTLKQ